jgi:hypothetical protein
MSDMSEVIMAKSDQINAVDLTGAPRTIKIRAINVQPGTEQPVTIQIEGDKKYFRPCKSMSRVLVRAWGPDSAKYVGKSLRIYNDPDVLWAGMKVGGIRISHMSDIDGEFTMALAENKKNRKPFTVKPMPQQRLQQQQPPAQRTPPATSEDDDDGRQGEPSGTDIAPGDANADPRLTKLYEIKNAIFAAPDIDALNAIVEREGSHVEAMTEAQQAELNAAHDARHAELSA